MTRWAARVRAAGNGCGSDGPRYPGSSRRDSEHEAGSATVAACLALAALIVLTVLLVQVCGVVAARHRAQAAADLAALAAAGELRYGTEPGCGIAAQLARRMGVGLLRCDVSEWDVLIEVREKVPIGPLGSRSVRAIARAGPLEEGQ